MEERDYLWKNPVFLSNTPNKHRYNKRKLINQIKGAIKKKSPIMNNRKQPNGMGKSSNGRNQVQGHGNDQYHNNMNNNRNDRNDNNRNVKNCNGGCKNNSNYKDFNKRNNNHNFGNQQGLQNNNNVNGQRHNHFKRNNTLRSLPHNIVDNKLQNNDKIDIRFDLKGVQHRILCQKLEKEIINIVPRIIDSISDDMIDFARELKEEQDHDKKMRERLHLQ